MTRIRSRLTAVLVGACLATIFATTAPATNPPSDPACPPQACIGFTWGAPIDNVVDIPIPPGLVDPDQSPAAPTAAAPSSQVQAPTVQTTTTTTTAADQTVTTVEQPKLPQPSSPPVTTQAEPPVPPPCQDGWHRDPGDPYGICHEIPKLDLQLTDDKTSVNAPGGIANFAISIVNRGQNRATGSAFRLHLDGNLSLAGPLRPSQGDPCTVVDSQTFVCAIGTIEPGAPVKVSISLKATANGTAYAYFEAGGEADTNTPSNDHISIHVVLTTLQTQRTVQQHGLLWGGHYYGSVQLFARVLAREGGTWRGWKKTHLSLAQGLVAHDRASRHK